MVQLTLLALALRWAIDVDGVLDIDTINFGLAAFRFDVLDHQPHPPGYPGYVLLLKLIHLVAPGLGPVEVAKWGCRISGALTVPAAFWACRAVRAAGGHPDAADPIPPLAAAAFAVVHPVLWYYGLDGQSHAIEALATLLLLGAAAKVKAAPGRARLLLLVAAFGLSGALRPTIPALSSPLLVWLFWRRPLADWALAGAVGIASVAAWMVPLVGLAGGWDLYVRAQRALVDELFIANYSVFGPRTRPTFVLVNLTIVFYGLILCLVPFLAWSGRGKGAPEGAWRRPIAAVLILNVAFYALVFCAEIGYLSAVAALACLAPATWRSPLPRVLGWRAVATVTALAAIFLAGPARVRAPFLSLETGLPTLAHIVGIAASHDAYRQVVCEAAGGEPALVVTDNAVPTHTRLLPMQCPGLLVAHHLHWTILNPDLDNWLVYDAFSLLTLPTEVPLETGPGARAALPRPVRRVILAPDASEEMRKALASQARCAPAAGAPGQPGPTWPDAAMVWPAECLPEIEVGRNVLEVPLRPRS